MIANTIAQTNTKTTSGNPVFNGWYADPEAAVFGKTYWIYPTYSDAYEKHACRSLNAAAWLTICEVGYKINPAG